MTNSSARFSFPEALLSSNNKPQLCIATLLTWIASCDGKISAEESKKLAETGKSEDGFTIQDALIWVQDIENLRLACDTVRQLQDSYRTLFLQTAIGLAVEDGYLTFSENHILRFISDLLGFLPAQLNTLFQETTGSDLPLPGDPSRIDWWEQRERARSQDRSARSSGQAAGNGEGNSRAQTPNEKMTRARALAILGLEEGVSENEIRENYIRLAKVHHPDRFASLGKEAVEASTKTFQRIQSAYQTLTKS